MTLSGRGFDADGDPLTYHWSTGQTTKEIVVDATTGVHFYRFTVADPYGAIGEAAVRVTVVAGNIPVITVLGANPATVEYGTTYSDAGATATDVEDGDVPVVTLGSINTSQLGTQYINYNAVDSSGNIATARRTVLVKDLTPPVITLKGANPLDWAYGKAYVDPG